MAWGFLFPLTELVTLAGVSTAKWEAYITGPRNGANTRLFAGLLQAGTSKAARVNETNLPRTIAGDVGRGA